MEKLNRGLKRKWTELENVTEDASRVPGKLHHGLKEVRKAAKKAKAFEAQKLVKKLKELRRQGEKKNTDIVEYEAQLNILKNIDHEIFANTATRTKIMKDKLLSQHEQVQESLPQELGDNLLTTSPNEGRAAKIHSRLLSSKLLATEISSLCDDLRELLGHGPKKTRKEVDTVQNLEVFGAINNSPPRKATITTRIPMDAEVGVETEEQRFIDETGWESGTVDGEEHDTGSLHLGSNSEGDSQNSELEDDIMSSNHRLAPPDASVKLKAAKQSGITSTFLPSLSVGFIQGSDESDWSDTEAKFADPGQKKNRRGQRARRAIWEKKYGRNANHKKKELEGQKDRYRNKSKQDSDPRRYAKSKITADGGKDGESGPLKPAAACPRTPAKQNDKPLHPSWEAKRKLKEQQSIGIVPPQGTRIKFSD